MAADVKRILVSLGLVLVLETVSTEGAIVLLFSFMSTAFFVSPMFCFSHRKYQCFIQVEQLEQAGREPPW